MKNGENLCSDDEGCTYRAWRVNSIDKGELMGKAAFPYRQRGDNVWLEGRNDNTGTNGNSVSTQISGNWNGVNIRKTSHIERGDKPRNIADNSAAKRNHRGVAQTAELGHAIQ